MTKCSILCRVIYYSTHELCVRFFTLLNLLSKAVLNCLRIPPPPPPCSICVHVQKWYQFPSWYC
ncbi:hypothetical protein CsSME_00006159 [Camellia sinensis var. sinensis]